MNLKSFELKILQQTRPLVVEFWAPWCHPCKAMAPFLSAAASKYQGKVDLLKVNVDESPEIAQSLRIMAVPTMIGYSGGKSVFRKTGFQPQSSIDKFFADLTEGKTTSKQEPALASRIFRAAAGLVLIIGGIAYNNSILLILLGVAITFSAFYDRCPIYRAVSGWIKNKVTKKAVR